MMVLMVGLKLLIPSAPPKHIDRAALLHAIDAGNVAEASFLRSGNEAEINGQLREPSTSFEAQIAASDIDDLTERLRAKGVSATVSNEIPKGSFGYYAVFGFIVLFFIAFFAIVVFQIKRIKRRRLELNARGSA